MFESTEKHSTPDQLEPAQEQVSKFLHSAKLRDLDLYRKERACEEEIRLFKNEWKDSASPVKVESLFEALREIQEERLSI
jgi:hypothetical protein